LTGASAPRAELRTAPSGAASGAHFDCVSVEILPSLRHPVKEALVKALAFIQRHPADTASAEAVLEFCPAQRFVIDGFGA